ENLEQLAKDHKKPYRHKLIYLGWNPDFLPEYFVGILYMWVSLLAFVWIFRRLMRETIETYHLFYLLIPILAVVLMPAYFAEYYCYLYDFPHLFLFTLGLYFLASRNWTAFLILYPISCLNKETTVLLTVIYLIHFGLHSNLSWRKFGAMLVYQGLVYLTIRTWLMHVFQDLPGGWVEHHFWRNVSLMQTHTHLFYALFGIWFVLATTMPYRWNRKPQFLRDAFWIGFILLPLDLFCGYLDELRTNYEVYPVALLLVVFTLGEKIGWMTAKDRRSVEEESQTDHSSMPSQVLD
ncbi:MAG: hypothetical protein KC978_19730, partial [Candidatus Omnitrophica bacterium]|nr:hypothetical protein [Candidatus Omnitrophota bacterium]